MSQDQVAGKALSKAQLLQGLAALFTMPEQPMPYEQAVVCSAAAALPEGTYVLYDEGEFAPAPAWVGVLPSRPLAVWRGTEQGSGGWGDLAAVNTSAGPGLAFSVNGSQAMSAYGFWVLPAGLEQKAG